MLNLNGPHQLLAAQARLEALRADAERHALLRQARDEGRAPLPPALTVPWGRRGAASPRPAGGYTPGGG